MPQFFINHSLQKNQIITLDGDAFHHIVRVRRTHMDEPVYLRDRAGTFYTTKIEEIDKEALTVRVTDTQELSVVKKICLLMPILKMKKNDFIIEKAVEVGVQKIIPVTYRRSVPDPAQSAKKLERWRKIAVEAYKQSFAPFLPEIEEIHKSIDIFSTHDDSLKLIADVHAETSLDERLEVGSLTVAIGPEGGFDPDELECARNNGWTLFKIATNQLRAETAAIVIPALLLEKMK